VFAHGADDKPIVHPSRHPRALTTGVRPAGAECRAEARAPWRVIPINADTPSFHRYGFFR
jgi:hypothetical protein